MGARDFRTNFEGRDIDSVMADLAPDFRLYHAGQEEPTTDVGFLRVMFPAIRDVFGDEFHFSDCVPARVRGAEFMVLPWTAKIDGIDVDGVDLARDDVEGRLLELRIAIRPVQAVQTVSNRMKTRLGAFRDTHHGGGAPPSG